MKRAVLYARVSTDKQSREGISIDAQEALARERCEREGWKLTAIYTDVMSGTRDKRPDFQRLLADAEGRAFDVLLVYRTDRLARSTLKLLQVVAELGDRGVGLVSLTEPLDLTTPMGKAMFQITATFAELESANTGARVRDAMRHRAATTGKHIGPTPDGYIREADGTLVPCPTRAPIILEAFTLYANGGTARSTCDTLNARGYRGRMGGPWRSGTLIPILKNPIYKGALTYGRHEVRKNSKGVKQRTLKNAAAWVTVEDAHPAIVPADLFDAVQSRLKDRAAVHPRQLHGQAKNPWSGLLRCGLCGGAMSYDTHQKSGWAYFRCGLRKTGGSAACPRMLTVGAVALDRFGVDALAAALAEPFEQRARQPARSKRIAPIRGRADRAAQIQRAIQKETDLYRMDAQSFEVTQANVAALKKQLAELDAEQPDTAPQGPPPILRNLREAWEAVGANPEAKGALLRGLVESVTVYPDRCELRPHPSLSGYIAPVITFKRKA